MEEVQPIFNEAFSLFSAIPENFRLWSLTFFMERSFCGKIYTLQGMKIKLSQHVRSPHQICSNNKEAKSFLSGFVTQKIRTWVSPLKIQISLEQFCISFTQISSMVTSSQTVLQDHYQNIDIETIHFG